MKKLFALIAVFGMLLFVAADGVIAVLAVPAAQENDFAHERYSSI